MKTPGFRDLSWMSCVLVCGAMLLSVSTVWAQSEAEKSQREVYSGVVVSVGGPTASMSKPITITIDRFTTDAEIKEYAETLLEGKVPGLRRELEKVKVGRIAPSGGLGVDIAIARKLNTPEGLRIRLVTARNMSFLELRQGGRSTDYPFSWVELTLDPEGKGQGTAMYAFKPKFTKDNVLEIESYGNQPLRVLNVRREK